MSREDEDAPSERDAMDVAHEWAESQQVQAEIEAAAKEAVK